MSAGAARPARSGSMLPATAALTAVSLTVVALLAWLQTVRDARAMAMPGSQLALGDGLLFTVQWGTMMAAMMLPSAAPMILTYRTVSSRLTAQGERAIPVAAFAALYVAAWLATGVPVYLAWVATGRLVARSPAVASSVPHAVAAVIAMAGLYQLTSAKRACLRRCESPLGFLMGRWRSGHRATARLALAHAGWCIGCCWGLMAILVVAGTMSLPWVVAIAAVVAAEKLSPTRWRVAPIIGVALLALATLVALRPGLVGPRAGGDAAMHERMGH